MEFHALLLIEEPPAAAELNLAGDGAVLEVADHRGENVVICRVKVVEHDFRQGVFAVEGVEVAREGAGLREVADRVHSGVGAAALEQAGVVVTQGTEVKLLCPTAFGVEAAEEKHDEPHPLCALIGSGGAAGAGLRENGGGLRLGAIGVRDAFQTVVGKAAAERVEEGVAAVERFEQGGQRGDLEAGAGGEQVSPSVEDDGCGDGHQLVRAVGRINAGL